MHNIQTRMDSFVDPGSARRARGALSVCVCLITALGLLFAWTAVRGLQDVLLLIETQSPESPESARLLRDLTLTLTMPEALRAPAGEWDPQLAADSLQRGLRTAGTLLGDYTAENTAKDLSDLHVAMTRWRDTGRRLLEELRRTEVQSEVLERKRLLYRAAQEQARERLTELGHLEAALDHTRVVRARASLESRLSAAEQALGMVIALLAALILVNLWHVHAGRRNAQALSQAAFNDPLTGLPNRRVLRLSLQDSIDQEHWGVIGLIKLERFTRVVHVYGPVFADEVLTAAAGRLASELKAARDGDIRLYRLEGTLFAAMFTATNRQHAQALLAAVCKGFITPLCVEEREVFLELRAGLVGFPDGAGDVDGLLAAADTALRFARDDALGPVRLYDPEMRASIERRTEIEKGLHSATSDGSINLHYQPQIDLVSGRLVGVEALIRWRHPNLGPISPAEFIPIAEEIGIITDIGRWVLLEACAQLARWRALGHTELRMSVNVSPLQLSAGDLPPLVADALTVAALPRNCLELEVTEGFSLHDMDVMTEMLDRLREVGVRIAVDDFGTGYSSLSYLRQLPVDVLKIDRSFIRDLHRDPKRYDLVRIVIDLGHALDFEVVAEGVEVPDELRALQWLGCDTAQGYLTAHPMAADTLEPLLAKPHWLPEGVLPLTRARKPLTRPLARNAN
jgi:predicted signal transduction protein with EAL and GGDEF domain